MTDLVEIDDPDDPRVAPYTRIRERDLVGHGGRFIAEGEVVVRQLLRGSRFVPESLLIAQHRLGALVGLLTDVPAGVPIYTAPQRVMDGVTGFSIHRGLLAVGLRGAEPSASELIAALPARARVLVAIGIANHDNTGALLRNAAAFGVDAVLLDETACDPLYRKSIRVSVGAALTVPFARGGGATALLGRLADAGFAVWALSPRGTVPIAEIATSPRLALMVGTEGPGLPAPLLAAVRTTQIPMTAGFDSLNVATAAAVALYEITRAR